LDLLRPISKWFACVALVVALFGSISTAAEAQSANGTLGWQSSAKPDGYFGSADAACRAQWQYYNPGGRYIGAFPSPGNPNIENCSWCTMQTCGCCGTTLPVFAYITCASGYTAVQGIRCVKTSNLVPARCNCKKTDKGNSRPNPEAADPIALSTGSSILTAQDYATADGQFVLGRSYLSLPFGRSVSFQSTPIGLAGGWEFDFMYELQLASFSGSPSSPNAKLALLAPDGTAYDFKMQSGGTFVPDTTTGAYYAPTDLKVEYLGTLPSDLSTLQSTSTQWRVTDGDDTVWTFQTFTRPNTSRPYAVGRPISRVTRDGYRWDFAYRSDNSLQTVTDSFGRQATFNWSMFYIWNSTTPPSNMLPYPEAISSVSLPDGTSLRYTYDPPPATAPPSTSQIQRLIKAERLDSTGATINSTTYGYADLRFPTSVTSITDFNGNQIATYAYDADGRAISSTHASGADAYALSNTDTSTEHVTTLTNPLGKVEDYHFPRYNNNAQDIRLGSIAGEASANTAASSQSVTYGSDAFVATETDEEGRVTSYTRDSRGRPTTIVEGYGTPQQRSTTITWDGTFNVPDRIVLPGVQVDYTYTPTGQLQTRTETDTTTQSVPYSTNGQTRTWTYSWGAGGRLNSINGPKPIDANGKDDTLTFAYDAAGNLQASTNGLGQTTTFANYDANGRPGTMADPNGIVTVFTYDVLGRTKTVTVKDPNNSAFDATTSFDYDIHDRVTGITLPATDKLSIDYDAAGRLVEMRAPSGERIDYTTDAEGNVTGETVKRADTSVARSVARSFDELGRLLTQTLGPGRTTTQAYDKVGNQTKTTSPMNGVTQAAFDPLNRLVSTVAPDMNVVIEARRRIER
jgi:YD repeat-containing protein